MTPARARWVLLSAALAVNLAVLYWPTTPGGPDLPGLDKVVHAASFAALAWAGSRAGLDARWWLPMLVVHGVVSETVQETALSHRAGDPYDVVADALGAVAGAALARASWRRDADRAAAGGDARAG